MNISLGKTLFCVLLSTFLVFCSKNEVKYPDKLSRAVDLFFLENKNDSVLLLLNSPEIQPEIQKNSELQQIKTIFSAGAICENGHPDRASALLRSINPDSKNKKLRYYYETILSLTEYRMYNYQEAYKLLLQLTDDDHQAFDIRALALNQRLMARVLYQFSDLNNSLLWFLQSKRSFEDAGLIKSAAVNDKFIASVCVDLNLLDSALPYLSSAEKYFLQYQDFDELFYTYIVYADLYTIQKKTQKAEEYTKKAISCTDVSQDVQVECYAHIYQSEVDRLNKKYDEAVAGLEKIFSFGLDYSNSLLIRRTAYLNLAKIYNETGQHDKSRINAYNALNTILGDRNDNLRYKIYHELAKSYQYENPEMVQRYLDSTVYFLNSHHSSSSVDLIKLFDSQQALHEAEHTADKQAFKLFVTTASIIFLLLVILVLSRISQINSIKNRALNELVKKNLLLLDEERKQNHSHQLIQKRTKSTSAADEERSRIIYSELINWLEQNGNFRRKDLSLDQLAKELNTNREYLSRAISGNEMRFHELINKYRIEETIKILSDPGDKRSKYNLKVIASDVGFNSQSVFIEAFRKHTGVTPAQFREHLNRNSGKCN